MAPKQPSSSEEEEEEEGSDSSSSQKSDNNGGSEPEPGDSAEFKSVDGEFGSEDDSRSTCRRASDRPINSSTIARNDGKDSKLHVKFERLWSERDEIALLEGLINYSSKKGLNPCAKSNTGAFYKFMKKLLHADVTRRQLVDKIRRLRKKYFNNERRAVKQGRDRIFSKCHEQKSYQLSKKIWGCDQEAGESSMPQQEDGIEAPKQEARGVEEGLRGEVDQSSCVTELLQYMGKNTPFSEGGGGFNIMKHGLELIGTAKRLELKKEWKKLHLAEMELSFRRTALVHELVSAAYNAHQH